MFWKTEIFLRECSSFDMFCFLFLQVSLLIHMNDEFSAEDFCTVIFDEFFFAGLARDNVPKHLLKLLWYIYPKLPAVRLQTLVKALQPTSQVKMEETYLMWLVWY
jgi:hypothetical protein